jgi:2-dehydropantoate 2-reductase
MKGVFMKIAVIGAGAMGSLFGALLAEKGYRVHLVDIWAEQVKAINERGLSIEGQGATRTVRLPATTNPAGLDPVDLAIVFVKSTQTAAAAVTARDLIGTSGVVLTLQNGMGNADAIAEAVSAHQVLAGTTAQGATLLGPGRIHHAGVGPTVIGGWSGTAEGDQKAEQVVEAFAAAGIETSHTQDVRRVVWEKLLVNVGINAITALTNIKNGQILDLTITRDLSRAAVSEAIQVAKACGVTVRADAPEHVLQVARATAANRSSMGQDVDNRRPTEIAAINGAVVAQAKKAGMRAPINETLFALVETLQGHYQGK